MLAISTNNIGMMDITSTNSKVKSKEEKAVDAFASLMNMTAIKGDKTDTTNDVSLNVSDTSKSSVNDNKDEVTGYEAMKKANNNDSANKYESTKKGQTKNVSSKKDEIDEETVISVVSGIKDLLADKLSMTDEEITELVSLSGMTFSDLLDPIKLKQFILDVNNSTEVDLLVNENLANLLDDVTASISELVLNALETENVEITEMIPKFNEIIEKIESEGVLVSEDELVNNVEVEVGVEVEKDTNVKTQNTNVEKVTEDEKNVDSIVSQVNVSEGENSGSNDKSFKQDFTSQASQIVNNLNDAINQVNDDFLMMDFDANIKEADIVRQIIDDIRVNLTKDETSITLQLNPENLGKVHVNVAQKDGVMQAQIVAETEAAKKAIENNIQVLKEAFDNKELKVEAVEVTVASHEFFGESSANEQEQNNASARTNKGTNITLNDSFDESELSEEETLQVEMMRNTGNSVNYTA